MALRTVFITGASSGIGRALALELASRGAHVAIGARRTEELARLARQIDERGGVALPIEVDVSNAEAARDAVRRADRELGSLDMVIANAGVGYFGHASTLQWADVANAIDVNIRGAMATLVAAIPIMLAQRRGHLVGVTSLAGRRGLPRTGAYSASKAALSAFLETLRVDLATAKIRVTDVQPGFVATRMADGRTHARPFEWTADHAARVIVKRLERAPATLAFPWALDAASTLARFLPVWLYDRAVRRAANIE